MDFTWTNFSAGAESALLDAKPATRPRNVRHAHGTYVYTYVYISARDKFLRFRMQTKTNIIPMTTFYLLLLET